MSAIKKKGLDYKLSFISLKLALISDLILKEEKKNFSSRAEFIPKKRRKQMLHCASIFSNNHPIRRMGWNPFYLLAESARGVT